MPLSEVIDNKAEKDFLKVARLIYKDDENQVINSPTLAFGNKKTMLD